MRKRIVGQKYRNLITILLLIVFHLIAYKATAADINIVDIRRNIQLSDDEPIYKDFFINAGTSSGLKQNMVVNVVRKLSIRNAAGTHSFGDFPATVGQLKIIAISNNLAVAREYKMFERDELPMLEYNFIMNGDQIDLKGSFVDNKKLSYKKKVVETKPTETLQQSSPSQNEESQAANTQENSSIPKEAVKPEIAKTKPKADEIKEESNKELALSPLPEQQTTAVDSKLE